MSKTPTEYSYSIAFQIFSVITVHIANHWKHKCLRSNMRGKWQHSRQSPSLAIVLSAEFRKKKLSLQCQPVFISEVLVWRCFSLGFLISGRDIFIFSGVSIILSFHNKTGIQTSRGSQFMLLTWFNSAHRCHNSNWPLKQPNIFQLQNHFPTNPNPINSTISFYRSRMIL